ncbi:MAG: Rnase Y domain-containing protein, partial [Patescibacteria group bacterium]|nr:Rnase Y domain-containing protein [Patescibacteria group bacterium]
MSLKVILLLLASAGVIGIAVGYFLRMIILLGQRGSMEIQIRKMMLDAEEKSKKILSEAEARAKERENQISGELKERERELKATEERFVRKEDLLDKRQTNLDTEQESLA